MRARRRATTWMKLAAYNATRRRPRSLPAEIAAWNRAQQGPASWRRDRPTQARVGHSTTCCARSPIEWPRSAAQPPTSNDRSRFPLLPCAATARGAGSDNARSPRERTLELGFSETWACRLGHGQQRELEAGRTLTFAARASTVGIHLDDAGSIEAGDAGSRRAGSVVQSTRCADLDVRPRRPPGYLRHRAGCGQPRQARASAAGRRATGSLNSPPSLSRRKAILEVRPPRCGGCPKVLTMPGRSGPGSHDQKLLFARHRSSGGSA